MTNNHKYKYMVVFKLPTFVDEEFLELIPKQRILIREFFNKNILQSYSLSNDNRRIWAVFLGISFEKVTEYVKTLPLSKYMNCEIRELMSDAHSPFELSRYSVN